MKRDRGRDADATERVEGRDAAERVESEGGKIPYGLNMRAERLSERVCRAPRVERGEGGEHERRRSVEEDGGWSGEDRRGEVGREGMGEEAGESTMGEDTPGVYERSRDAEAGVRLMGRGIEEDGR